MTFKYIRLVTPIATLAVAFLGAGAAQAGGAVVVSAKSSIDALTADQVSQLFLGKNPTLPGGTTAVLIDQAEGAATREAFYAKVAGRNATQMKALWSRLIFSGAALPPKAVASDAEVKKAVNDTSGAIGYIDSSAVDASVKVVLTFQ